MSPPKPRGRPSNEVAASRNALATEHHHHHHLDNPNSSTPQEASRSTSKKVARTSPSIAMLAGDVVKVDPNDPVVVNRARATIASRYAHRRNDDPTHIIRARGRLKEARRW